MAELTYNVTEAAEALGVSRRTMYDLINREGFPTLKVGTAADKPGATGGMGEGPVGRAERSRPRYYEHPERQRRNGSDRSQSRLQYIRKAEVTQV